MQLNGELPQQIAERPHRVPMVCPKTPAVLDGENEERKEARNVRPDCDSSTTSEVGTVGRRDRGNKRAIVARLEELPLPYRQSSDEKMGK